MALAVACACIALRAWPVTATTYFVDGACKAPGDGTVLTCSGPHAPFQTIADGILAMQAGDTLNIRGAHGTFDGVYFEALMLRDLAPLPGKALACTPVDPCVIQGCRAGACPSDEQPVIRGMTRRIDWVAQDGGVWARTMEPGPVPDGLERDAFDPHMLLEGSATPLTPMAYAGDGVAAPAEGQWSYDPASHQIMVTPTGAADPATTVYVPHFGYNLHVQSPSANVTIQYMTFEGTRGRSIDVETLPPVPVTGIVLGHLVQRYVPRYFIIATRRAPGLLIEDSLAEYGCRGLSWALPTNGGCMGYRLFGIDGGAMRRNVIRHLGAAGKSKFSGGPNGWPCPWCETPWNDPTHTVNSTYGLAYQVKQTDTATVEDNRAEDVATGGISLDVSRGVTVQRNTVHRAATGVGILNFTPTGGCPTTAATDFCYNSDHVIRANVLDEVGYANMDGCAVEVIAGSERHVGGVMLAQIYNNMISRIGSAAICVHNEGGTPTADLSIWNNTFYGARAVQGADPPSGVVVADATRNVVVLDNVFDGLTSDGLVVTTAGAQGLSLDGDVIGTVGGCEVRWGDVGACDTLVMHEAHGRTGPLLFAQVNAAPLDLHLTALSTAIDAGVDNPAVRTDIDGDARPLGAGWDAGADEFGGPFATTTTTTAPSTTSSLVSSTSTSTSVPGSTSTSSTATPTTSTSTTSTRTTSTRTTSTSTTSTRTTSTRTTSTSTTSTLGAITPPPDVVGRLSGQTLLLTVKARNPNARRFRVVSRDRTHLDIGDAGGIPALIAQGGSVRIAAIGGDAFAKTYTLEPDKWHVIERHGRGVRFVDDDGPITLVRFDVGKQLVVQGKGSDLDQSLDREPTVVTVELRIGSRTFCLAFGGAQHQFASRKKLRRTKSQRPASCPEP